jgi:hypothetical protein
VFHSLVNLSPSDPVQLSVIERFWQQADLLLSVGLGLGFARVFGFLSTPRKAAVRWGSLALVFVFLAPKLSEGISARSARDRGILAAYGKSLLESVPRNAIILVRGDLRANILIYLQECEAMRPDVRILETELMTYPWYRFRTPNSVTLPGWSYRPGSGAGYLIGDWLDLQNESEPGIRIFELGGFRAEDRSNEKSYRLVQNSVFQEIVPLNSTAEPEPLSPQFGNLGSIFNLIQYAPGSWEFPIIQEIRTKVRK